MDLTRDLVRSQFLARFARFPETVARAPGRVEFIGNHTDYNGGAVLGAAIDRHVWVAAARGEEGCLRFSSGEAGEIVVVDASVPGSMAATWPRWIDYPLGVWRSLGALGYSRPASFDLLVLSDLPMGAGLSSSAALELATALALLEIGGSGPVTPATLAAIGRHAENVHVGVPCGILDQGTCALGAPDHLVHIDCRGPVFTRVRIPAEARLWVFDTHEKHALVDGLYAERHRECTAAARTLGVEWLAQLAPADLARVAGILAQPALRRVRHVVEENARVAAAVAALQGGDLRAAGSLLTASHASSRDLFENSTPALDSLVRLLAGHPRVLGARLTGGGFGGAVLALTGRDFSVDDAEAIAGAQARRGFRRPPILGLRTAAGAGVVEAGSAPRPAQGRRD